MTDYEYMLEQQKLREAEAQKAQMMLAQQQALRDQMNAQQQGGGGGMDPGMAMNIGKQFMGGGEAAAGAAGGAGSALTGAEAASFVPAMAPEVIGGAAVPQMGTALAGNVGGGAAGGGVGGGGMLAAAGPWAALAAVIAVNEKQARDKGRRSENPGHHLQQMLTGEGMSNDMDALGDKVGGPFGQSIRTMGKLGSPIDATKSTLKHTKKALKKPFEPWEWF